MAGDLRSMRERLDVPPTRAYGERMDALSSLLDGLRGDGAFLLRTSWQGPWSLRIMSEAPLTVLSAPKGEFCVVHDGREPTWVRPGDLVITRGPDHYLTADHPDTEPTIEIHEGEACYSLDGRPMEEEMSLGVRSWGNHLDGDTVMMVGAYLSIGEIGERLAKALPPIIHLGPDDWDDTLVRVLDAEVMRDHPGQTTVLDRLLDLLVVSALRDWFERPEAEPPGWYRAQSDPIVGTAIRLMQNNPAEQWTVAQLASEVGASRAVLARRFSELVGVPPMEFLTSWRIDLAADLLRSSDLTIAAVADRVGYSTPFALSAAFKRVRGMSPSEHRQLEAV